MLFLGLSRVIVGTRHVVTQIGLRTWSKNLGQIELLLESMPEMEKWLPKDGETTNTLATDLARQVQDLGIRWIIHTDVATDGAMQGPNFETQQKMALAAPSCNIIASGE